MDLKIRKYFNLPKEGKICDGCRDKYIKKYKIDNILHQNAIIQSNLGIDSTQEERDEASKMSRKLAMTVAKYDKQFAMSAFFEEYRV